MTYGDLTREEVDRVISNPYAMAILEENYNRAMAEFNAAVHADIARMMREEMVMPHPDDDEDPEPEDETLP